MLICTKILCHFNALRFTILLSLFFLIAEIGVVQFIVADEK